jgi:hypothetical protein
MSSLFKAPTINVSPPTPVPPPPMPDPYSPAAMEAAKAQAAMRAGRTSTMLTTAANQGGTAAGAGVTAPYGGKALGG